MKKRIVTLLLAGLLTASLVACTTTQERPNNGNGGTEQYTPTDPNNNPSAPLTWTDVNETVYVTAAMTLTGVDNPGDTTAVRLLDKLQRVRVGTGSNTQSIVVKDGKQYYAATKNLTADDLLGENFTALTAPKTMYVAEQKLNIRKYASSESFSTIITTLEMNSTVKVIAVGGQWSMIEYSGSNCFVFSECLSETEVVDPDDINNYDMSAFDDFEESEHEDMYVILKYDDGSLALRTCPSSKSTAKEYLSKGDRVVRIGKGMVDGTEWSKIYILIQPDEDEGTGEQSVEGYVPSDFVSENKNGVPEVSLEDMIKEYPAFSKLDAPQTMYVNENIGSSTLIVRSSPEIPEKNANYVDELNFKDQVKVVATGKGGEVFWAMIEQSQGEYYFVSYKYLTTDPAGKIVPLTFEQLLSTYPAFDECTPTTYYTTKEINCNTIPEYQKADEVPEKLAKGTAVTVVAKAKINHITWYLYRTAEGNYYFAGADLLTTTQPSA